MRTLRTLVGMRSLALFPALAVEYWLFIALAVVGAGLALWATIDCLRRPAELFVRAGLRDKNFWTLLNVAALAVAAFSVAFRSGMGMLGIIALCISAVYLAGPREQLNLYSGYRR